MNDESIVCTVYNSTTNKFFDDVDPGNSRTQTLIIGGGFDGFMRKIKIYDYPKMEPSMKMMYKVAPE